MSEKNDITAAARTKLVSSTEQACKAWEVTTDAAKNMGQTVKKEAQEAFVSGKEYLGKAVQSFGEAASESYGALRDQAQAKVEGAFQEASSKAKDVQTDMEHYIRANPLKSVCIAIGLGFVVASIFKR